MKRPHFHWPKPDFHSVGFQTAVEIAAGGIFTALLLRWLM
jgi:hypothetical protein